MTTGPYSHRLHRWYNDESDFRFSTWICRHIHVDFHDFPNLNVWSSVIHHWIRNRPYFSDIIMLRWICRHIHVEKRKSTWDLRVSWYATVVSPNTPLNVELAPLFRFHNTRWIFGVIAWWIMRSTSALWYLESGANSASNGILGLHNGCIWRNT